MGDILERLKQYKGHLQQIIEQQSTLSRKYEIPANKEKARHKYQALEKAVRILDNKFPELKE